MAVSYLLFEKVTNTSADEKFPEILAAFAEGLKLVPPGRDSDKRPSCCVHARNRRSFRSNFRAKIFRRPQSLVTFFKK